MSDMSKALDVASQILTDAIIFSGVLAFLFKQGISAWIRSRFTREVNSALEIEKHKFEYEWGRSLRSPLKY